MPDFMSGHVAFYEKEEEARVLNVYRTYIGDIIVDFGRYYEFTKNCKLSLSDFNPTDKKYSWMKKKTSAITLKERSFYFKSLEGCSYLYSDSYNAILTNRFKSGASSVFNELREKMIIELRMEERDMYESCVIWTKEHQYMNWE